MRTASSILAGLATLLVAGRGQQQCTTLTYELKSEIGGVNVHGTAPYTCDAVMQGKMYFDTTAMSLKICVDGVWVGPGGGPAKVATKADGDAACNGSKIGSIFFVEDSEMSLLCTGAGLAPLTSSCSKTGTNPVWYDCGLPWRRPVPLNGAIQAGAVIRASFDHAMYVQGGISNSDGSDIRVAAFAAGVWTELPRVVYFAGTAGAQVHFKLPTEVAAGGDSSTYWVYGGAGTNLAAGALLDTASGIASSNTDDIYTYFQDFEGGSAGANVPGWVHDAEGAPHTLQYKEDNGKMIGDVKTNSCASSICHGPFYKPGKTWTDYVYELSYNQLTAHHSAVGGWCGPSVRNSGDPYSSRDFWMFQMSHAGSDSASTQGTMRNYVDGADSNWSNDYDIHPGNVLNRWYRIRVEVNGQKVTMAHGKLEDYKAGDKLFEYRSETTVGQTIPQGTIGWACHTSDSPENTNLDDIIVYPYVASHADKTALGAPVFLSNVANDVSFSRTAATCAELQAMTTAPLANGPHAVSLGRGSTQTVYCLFQAESGMGAALAKVLEQGAMTLVRRSAVNAWHPGNDNLAGAPVGTIDATTAGPGSTFSADFQSATFSEFMFMTGDFSVGMVTSRPSVQSPSRDTTDCADSIKSQAGSRNWAWDDTTGVDTLGSNQGPFWCRRTAQPEDPWISIGSHNGSPGMMYGENAHAGWGAFKDRGGITVWIR